MSVKKISTKHTQGHDQQPSDQDVDLTPMLDVVFIMLIFFIVTASFIKEEGLALNSPPPSTGAKLEHSIVLEVLQANKITIANRPVEIRSIKPTIVRLKAESPNAQVSVRLHRRAKTQTVVAAIDALAAANVLQPPMSLIKI